MYIVWKRQSPYLDKGPDMGKILLRHISACVIEVGVGMQRDAYTGGLKARQGITCRSGVSSSGEQLKKYRLF